MHGVVQLMCQTLDLHWSQRRDNHGETKHSQKLLLLPKIIENNQASTLIEALEQAVPGLAIDGMFRLSQLVPFIVLS